MPQQIMKDSNWLSSNWPKKSSKGSDTTINQSSSLSRYFKHELEKEKNEKKNSFVQYEIQDPNQAVFKVKSILDQEAVALLKSIQATQSIDDNAAYHFLNAYVYLILDDSKSAVSELKKYLIERAPMLV